MKLKKGLLIMLAALLLAAGLAPTASANSAEPPGIVIIVNSPPDDLELFLRFGTDEEILLSRTKTAWETRYSFYYDGMSGRYDFSQVQLRADSAEHSFTLELSGDDLKQYNNFFTLNLKSERLTEGMTFMRGVTIIGLRVILTLIIEGAVFFAFMYREKRSWLVFLAVNLVTQAALNAFLYGSVGGSLLLGLIICEIGIFIVEILAFMFLLKEHKKPRAAAYAFIANLLSLFLGAAMIMFLPV